jgi:hypothetical protein
VKVVERVSQRLLLIDGASRWGHIVQIMVSDGAITRYSLGMDWYVPHCWRLVMPRSSFSLCVRLCCAPVVAIVSENALNLVL